MQKKHTLLGKNLVFSIIIVILVGLSTAVTSYFIQDKILNKEIYNRTAGIAKLWNSQFDLEDVKSALSDSDLQSEIQQQFTSNLNHLTELEPDVGQGYILDNEYANNNKDLRIIAAPQHIIDAGFPPGSEYANPILLDAYEKALTTKKIANTEIYSDEFGTWQSVLLPVLDKSDEVIAVFGVDLNAGITEELRKEFLITLSIGMLISLLVVITLQFFGLKRMLAPIKDIEQAINEVSQGNLTATIKITSKDEFGMLGNHFNRMTESLSNLVASVYKVNSNVKESSNEFLRIASETYESSNRFNFSIGEVAVSLEEQTRSSQESARAMEEMAIGIQKAAESATTVSQKSETTLDQTIKGNEYIQVATQQMNLISSTVGESAMVIKKLGDRSKEIGEIISVISGIAEQTNLLALNAAIEAARAGEHGKGFAVVANEVRQLAEQSKSATTRIGELIIQTQKDTNQAVEVMEKGTSEVVKGEQAIKNVDDIIKQIVSSTELVSGEIQESSAIFEEMSASSEQINASVDEIATVASKSLAVFKELTEETEKQLNSMMLMEESSRDIAEKAIELENKLKSFTIN